MDKLLAGELPHTIVNSFQNHSSGRSYTGSNGSAGKQPRGRGGDEEEVGEDTGLLINEEREEKEEKRERIAKIALNGEPADYSLRPPCFLKV